MVAAHLRPIAKMAFKGPLSGADCDLAAVMAGQN